MYCATQVSLATVFQLTSTGVCMLTQDVLQNQYQYPLPICMHAPEVSGLLQEWPAARAYLSSICRT